MGLYHTCLITDILPGTVPVLTEDQQGQVSQHYEQHTGGLREAREIVVHDSTGMGSAREEKATSRGAPQGPREKEAGV